MGSFYHPILDALLQASIMLAIAISAAFVSAIIHSFKSTFTEQLPPPREDWEMKLFNECVTENNSEWKLPLEIKKMQPDQQLIFGWASVVEKDGQAIIDKQGDIIPVAELEKAAYDFTIHSRNHGDMHRQVGTGKLVESMVFTKEKQEALGIDLGMVGWWVGFKVDDTNLWDAHKRGERTEFSIGGSAIHSHRS